MTNKENWDSMTQTHETTKTFKQCQTLIGGSKRYGMGGKWTKAGDKYLALNGHLSRNGMPLKLKCKDATIPISQTDLTVLVDKRFVVGVSPVEFE